MNEAEMNKQLKKLLEHHDYSSKYQVTVFDRKIDVPVVYAHASALMAFFPISLDKAVKLLKTKRLKPVSILGGRCLVGVTIFDYHDCPVGPYRELALSIPVTLDSAFSVPLLPLFFDSLFSTFGFYTLLLAMNTDIARAHSEHIFGYPTFSRNIEIDIIKDDTTIAIEAREKNEKIMSFRLKKPDNLRAIKKKYITYFIKNDTIISVEMQTAAFEAHSAKSDQPMLELGTHEIARILGMLSIEPRALQSVYYADAIEILNAPKKEGGL